jgi:hypothetical protein
VRRCERVLVGSSVALVWGGAVGALISVELRTLDEGPHIGWLDRESRVAVEPLLAGHLEHGGGHGQDRSPQNEKPLPGDGEEVFSVAPRRSLGG